MSKIKVKLFTVTDGLVEYDDVKLIRIKSDKYNLLIMEDYLPIIGDINGNITIEMNDDVVVKENIIGYYMHKNNTFELIIKE